MKSFTLDDIPKAVQLKRKGLFTPCETKEQLLQWCRLYLGIRLPSKTVTKESNSSPGELMWEIYDRCRRNDLDGFEKVMAYASRFSGKTMVAAMLEVLVMLHMPRNVAHMAAIENQAKKAQQYVKDHFSRPILRDFVFGDNAREVKVVSWMHRESGVPLTDKEFNKLSLDQKEAFQRREQSVKIIICNMAGANGDHTEYLTIDELDVIPKQNIKAYDQAKGGIPVGRDGCTAFTLYTSTRKSRVGLVQKEIDKASETGLVLRHWNAVDVTEPCPPTRHLPDAPKQTYFVNDGDVKHISKAEYDILPGPEQSKWYGVEGYAGCASCRLFPACKGDLATKQEGHVGAFGDGGTALLVKIPEIASKFRGNTPEFITTEFLCRKPDTSGLVYPRLREDLHMKSAMEIAKMVGGDDLPIQKLVTIKDKPSLIAYLKEVGCRFYTGMDFGFSHIFAVVTIAVWGQNAFVIDAIGQAGLELEDKVAICQHLKALEPTIYGDPESPESIATFKRRGFKMATWSKGQGSVNAGIEVVRTKIWNLERGASLFFLEGDPSVAAAFKEMAEYCFKTDAAGNFSNVPEDEGDDHADACRYVIMNVFARQGALKSEASVPDAAPPQADPMAAIRAQQQNWLSDHVRMLTGEASPSDEPQGQVVKKGGFIWDPG